MKNFSFAFGLACMVSACSVDIQVEDDGTSGSTSSVTSTSATSVASTGASAPTSSSSTGSSGGGAGGSGSSGVGGADVCATMKDVTLSDLVLVDAGGDGVWSPGESASMQVTLTNQSPADNFNYPGFTVSADAPGFTSSGNTLFGLFGSQSTVVPFDVQADSAVPAGTTVELTLHVTTLGADCPALDTLKQSFTVQ
ncbi:MAG: hypothetical protein U0414_00420 [Polyangiaceae bacterium]